MDDKMLGRYRLLERIAVGGMGVVYKAMMKGVEGFERCVVVKQVRPELSRNAEFVRSLVAEARLAARLHHPGIVQVFELGQADDEHFLAMEYIEGADLSALLASGRRIPPGLCCYVIGEIAAALGYLHALKDEEQRPLEIVHRDITPSNIMISTGGAVKILDFGVAKAAVRARTEVTEAGTLKGKLSYMSPEQSEGEPVDRRSDIFALGVVLHECLTGKRLFRGHDDFHTLRLIKEAKVTPPSQLASDIEAELDQIVLKMLSRDRAERYQSCEEVVAAVAPVIHRLHADAAQLRAFMETRGPAAPRRDELSEASTTTDGLRPDTEAIAAAPRNRLLRWQLLAVAASCVLLVASAWIWHHRSNVEHAVVAAPVVTATPTTPLAPSTSPSQAELPAPGDSPSAPEDGDQVQLRVSGVNGAQVLIDGHDVGRIPLEISLPTKKSTRTVLVHRVGYLSYSTVIPGDESAVLTAHMRPTMSRPQLSPGDIKNPFSR
jgi:serine/threonine protein kinase